MNLKVLWGGMLALVAIGPAQAVSCMVVGERSARVLAKEGEKSPLFHTQFCESLRLVSGKAMVSWVGRDGKAHFSPIGPQGVEKLPSAGAEERSGNLVWAELTSTREAVRPAFMRAIGDDRPTQVFIPAEGLTLPIMTGADLRVLVGFGRSEQVLMERPAGDGSAIVLGRQLLQLGGNYTLQWRTADRVEQWKWHILNAEETQGIEAKLKELEAAVADPAQQRILAAMMFEQSRLRLNMSLAVRAKP